MHFIITIYIVLNVIILMIIDTFNICVNIKISGVPGGRRGHNHLYMNTVPIVILLLTFLLRLVLRLKLAFLSTFLLTVLLTFLY